MDFDLEQQARESLGASSAFPLGEPNTAFAQYFIGNSFLAPLAGGVANVTFEPGCRNNWHVHLGERQVLVCTGGASCGRRRGHSARGETLARRRQGFLVHAHCHRHAGQGVRRAV